MTQNLFIYTIFAAKFRKKNSLKRILLYTIFLFGAGCKVTQPPGNISEKQPESSHQMTPEEPVFVVTDSIPADGKAIVSGDTVVTEIFPMTDSLEYATNDSITGITPVDSLGLPLDSLLSTYEDVLALTDTIPDTIPRKKGALEAPVDYSSKDSIIWTAGNMASLFGEGNVKYQTIELKADFIQMNMDSSQVYATYRTDSLGNETGHPEFSDGAQEMESKEMYYNFKSTAGRTIGSISKQGDGYIISDVAKKLPDGCLNMKDGKYTTCDELDHPHFYMRMFKAKVWPGKNVVSGPIQLVIEDVPLPLALPFAFFPFTDTYSSGIIMPTYGDEMNRGFFLRNGGYYFALSDYLDLTMTGEWYTKGSWGLSGQTSYRKRYKYSGNISLSTLTTITGDKGLDDYQKRKDFSIKISHAQDAKANPFQTVSASVDYSSSSYDRNQLNSLYTPAATQNNKGSSVSYSRKFPNSPFNLSAAMNINQRSQDSSVSVTLPDLTLTMARIYPFKRKSAIGDHWYDKISVNYNAQLRNSISTKEDLLFQSNLIKDWKNGMSHKADVNATYSVLNYINLSPNFSYTERWYSHQIEQAYNPESNRMMQSDTVYGFNRVYNYSASISASTTLYGTYTPWKPFQKYVEKIRHRFEPSISFSAVPDFGDPKYGFYRKYMYLDGTHAFPGVAPDTITNIYSPYTGQLFGVPGQGKSGSISFNVANNIEAKIRDDNEPSGLRKISLVDNLTAGISYNLAADSFNWSSLNTSMRLKLTKSYTLNLNAVFDTYLYDYDEIRGPNNTVTYRPHRVNKPRFAAGKGFGRIGRLQSTGTSFSYTFNNESFKKWFGGKDESGGNRKNKNDNTDYDNMEDDEFDPDNPNDPKDMQTDATKDRKGGMLGKKKQTTGDYDEDGYYNVTIPWSLSVNYNLSVGYNTQKFNLEKKEYEYQFVHAFSFNGNLQPTKNWRLTFSATYDFKNHKIPYATCSISRAMHCWQMSANVIPVGQMKSYSFSISANATMLKDLKWDQRSSPYNNQTWY